jgi:hypothetical protein
MTRRNFTTKTKALIRERSGGTCEVHLVPRCMYPALPEACKRAGAEVDHITPDVFDGGNQPENGAFLCGLCHKIKTYTDNREAKKSNRIRGVTGKATGKHKQIASAGFSKTLRRKMNGTTVRRKT